MIVLKLSCGINNGNIASTTKAISVYLFFLNEIFYILFWKILLILNIKYFQRVEICTRDRINKHKEWSYVQGVEEMCTYRTT
jgi:hypothetical protein